jgi:hypothetical protein
MILRYGSYSHSCIGYPGMVLKWHVEDGVWTGGYVVRLGLILSGGWSWEESRPGYHRAEREMERFDKWVRDFHGDDITIQG